MEDSHIAELDLGNGVSFFGVYDGHGGKSNIKSLFSISKPINSKWLISIGNEVADYVKEHLISELKKMDSFINKNYKKALEDIYIKMDIDI